MDRDLRDCRLGYCSWIHKHVYCLDLVLPARPTCRDTTMVWPSTLLAPGIFERSVVSTPISRSLCGCCWLPTFSTALLLCSCLRSTMSPRCSRVIVPRKRYSCLPPLLRLRFWHWARHGFRIKQACTARQLTPQRNVPGSSGLLWVVIDTSLVLPRPVHLDM